MRQRRVASRRQHYINSQDRLSWQSGTGHVSQEKTPTHQIWIWSGGVGQPSTWEVCDGTRPTLFNRSTSTGRRKLHPGWRVQSTGTYAVDKHNGPGQLRYPAGHRATEEPATTPSSRPASAPKYGNNADLWRSDCIRTTRSRNGRIRRLRRGSRVEHQLKSCGNRK